MRDHLFADIMESMRPECLIGLHFEFPIRLLKGREESEHIVRVVIRTNLLLIWALTEYVGNVLSKKIREIINFFITKPLEGFEPLTFGFFAFLDTKPLLYP